MHPHQNVFMPGDVSANERDVLLAVERADVGDRAESSIRSVKAPFAAALDEVLVFQPVADQARDGDHFHAVTLAKLGKLWYAGHGSIGIHDFADHAAGLESGHSSQIDCRLGLTGPHQYAAFARPKRKHV